MNAFTALGARAINADSFSELKRIVKMAAKNHKRINVGLRLNTRYAWKKFGVPIQYSEQFFRAGAKLKNVKLNSIHVHLGTDIRSTTPYTHAVADVTRLMSLLKKSGIAIEFLDLGGGFTKGNVGRWGGMTFLQTVTKWLTRFSLGKLQDRIDLSKAIYAPAPTLDEYSSNICNKLKKEVEERDLPLPTLLLEPGRYLVNDTFTLLLSVVDLKESGKEQWVMVDGGINLAPFLDIEAHRIFNASKKSSKHKEFKMGGPLCTERDILCRKAVIAPPEQGDLIEILDVGAYSVSLSWQFIRPRAPVVMITDNGEVKETRRRETAEDILKLDSFAF